MKRGHRQHRIARAVYRDQAKTNGDECVLCEEPIDYALLYPDPGMWTLEHTVPLSQGGSLTDQTYWASAHLRCQLKQGGQLAHKAANPTSRVW